MADGSAEQAGYVVIEGETHEDEAAAQSRSAGPRPASIPTADGPWRVPRAGRGSGHRRVSEWAAGSARRDSHSLWTGTRGTQRCPVAPRIPRIGTGPLRFFADTSPLATFHSRRTVSTDISQALSMADGVNGRSAAYACPRAPARVPPAAPASGRSDVRRRARPFDLHRHHDAPAERSTASCRSALPRVAEGGGRARGSPATGADRDVRLEAGPARRRTRGSSDARGAWPDT